MIWINQIVTKLDSFVGSTAAADGFTYVNDLTAYSGGHYLCEKPSYIHAAVPSDIVISFHPTNAGQQVIAADLEKALGIG